MKNIPTLLVVSLMALTLAGCDLFVSEAPTITPTPVATPTIVEDDTEMMDEMDEEVDSRDEEMMENKDNMQDSTMEKNEMDESTTNTNDGEASNVTLDDKFKPYSESTFASDISSGRNIIMFSASWCPTCQLSKRDIAVNFNDLPADVTIYEADYDNDTDLKTEYSVVIQDTMVLVDNNGNEIKKWTTQGRGVDAVLDNLV